MTLSANDVLSLLRDLENLRQRIEDLESGVNESRDFVVADSYPANAFENQIVLRTDQPGANGGGTLYRYSSGVWVLI